MTTDRIIDKLRKIHAHSESAASLGNEAEAQAFAAAFQRLLTEHKLEMSDVEFAQAEVDDPVARHEIDYSKYPEFKHKKARISWAVHLNSAIAKAHFCRIILHQKSNTISLVGRKQDTEVAEFMIITLNRAAERIANRELQKYRWEIYKRDRNCEAASGFRAAFLFGFTQRLVERYEEERRRTEGDGSNSTALVRLRREERAVEDFINELKGKTTTTIMKSRHREGTERGRVVANGIQLRSTGINAGVTKGALS